MYKRQANICSAVEKKIVQVPPYFIFPLPKPHPHPSAPFSEKIKNLYTRTVIPSTQKGN
ncbi:hypothetical protein [uncultured Akkermansia sp.]|uniref:hypothetical protein n=1 Tax=uncultured Akkermansia sp. TaxID=512294 RepID=UPI002598D206|nr:hypothetical protein [uncultured Akkermansia sp.]